MNKLISNNSEITEVSHIKFLGLEIDNTLSWNVHINHIITKLNTVCYMLRVLKPYISYSSLLTCYYSLFHSIFSYGIIFWGHAAGSNKIFILQKRAIRIMTGQTNRTSCRSFFKQLKILPMKSQYIYSILSFVVKNRNLFTLNGDKHNILTRQSGDLYLPSSSLTLYQNGVHFTGVKIFNNLPRELKQLAVTPNKFKRTLREYLVSHCFYSLDEYFRMNCDTCI